jgi:hypothetical protein
MKDAEMVMANFKRFDELEVMRRERVPRVSRSSGHWPIRRVGSAFSLVHSLELVSTSNFQPQDQNEPAIALPLSRSLDTYVKL